MRLLFYTVLTMSLSPIWPLGQNPLKEIRMSLLINKRTSLRILIMGKFKKSTRLLLAKQLI